MTSRAFMWKITGRMNVVYQNRDISREWRQIAGRQATLEPPMDIRYPHYAVGREGGWRPRPTRSVARMSAIKSNTWNHPVLAGDRLLVSNGD